MSRRRTYWSLVLLCLLAATSVVAAHASLLGVQLNLRADPQRAPADGRTPVAISVEVLSASGAPVADGTSVYFVTTMGEIVSPVETVGGIAQTVLSPSNAAGTALVSVMVGSARASLEVEFTGTPGSASAGSRMIELSAEDLSYNAEQRTFVAGASARLTYEMIEITADAFQYDVMSNVLCAQGDVLLRSSGHELRADALRYDLDSLRGRLLRVTDEAELLLVEGHKLQTRPDTKGDPCLWYPAPQIELNTWVKARTAVVSPRKKVILDHAAVYFNDLRVMGLRRHVLDPQTGGAIFGNTFAYSSIMGANLDVPIYYRASGNQVGSLHIKRNRALGGAGTGPGWGLGMKEEYFREGHSEGVFAVEDITDPGRGLSWRHQLKLGRGAALSLDASTATFEDDAPSLRAGGLTYFQPLSAGRLSLSLSGSDYGGSRHYYSGLAYRFRTTRLGSGILVSPVVHVRRSVRHNEEDEVLVDPETGEMLEISAADTGRTTSPGFDLSFSLPRRNLSEKTQLTASLMTGYAWGLEDGPRSVLDGRFGLVHRLGATQYLKLDYSYSGRPASLQPSAFAIGRQRLSLNGNVSLQEWHVRFNASQEIGGDRLFGHLTLVHPLPWGKDTRGNPLWQLHGSHMFSHFSDCSLASSRIALSRAMGRYRLALCYSPQGSGGYESRPWINFDGYGYTYSGGRHLWIELSALGY